MNAAGLARKKGGLQALCRGCSKYTRDPVLQHSPLLLLLLRGCWGLSRKVPLMRSQRAMVCLDVKSRKGRHLWHHLSEPGSGSACLSRQQPGPAPGASFSQPCLEMLQGRSPARMQSGTRQHSGRVGWGALGHSSLPCVDSASVSMCGPDASCQSTCSRGTLPTRNVLSTEQTSVSGKAKPIAP